MSNKTTPRECSTITTDILSRVSSTVAIHLSMIEDLKRFSREQIVKIKEQESSLKHLEEEIRREVEKEISMLKELKKEKGNLKELKKEKRKLKKDRQKEKTNQAKLKSDINTEDIINKTEQVAKKENSDKDIKLQKQEDSHSFTMSDNNDLDSADIDFATEESAFIQSIVNQKDIVKKQQQKKYDSGKVKESPKNQIHKLDGMVSNDSNGFTSVKKGTKHTPAAVFCKTPEGFGNEALRLIRENELKSAIDCLNRGIALDRSDSRHYINRSYCYLRLGEYEKALADIKFASSHLTDIHEMSRAKCREGQALSGLQHYEAAELAFKESINLAPDFLFAKRELKRTQIMRILDMGFKERGAILALQQKTTTMDAITLLSEESLTTASYDSSASSNEEDEDDDDIFYSDSEENPSNVRLMSKLLKYHPNMPEEPYIVPELLPPYKDQIHNQSHRPQTPSQDLPLRIIKAVAPVAKTKRPNPLINSMAIWVGSLTPQIKDKTIKQRFSRFGRVVSVERVPPSNTYAFVNFQSTAAAQKALDEATFSGGTIEVSGFKLPINYATNKSKTIK